MLDPIGERTFRDLRTAILIGELPGGTRLVEEQLAARQGVSRTPVREALRRLAQLGLVDLIPRGGALVKQITTEGITSAYACRGALEGLAVSLASVRRTRRDLVEMEGIQEQAVEALKKRRVEDLISANAMFHEMLIRSANDPILMELLDHLALYGAKYRQEVVALCKQSDRARRLYLGHAKRLVAEHGRILEFIAEHKGREAENLVRHHLNDTAAEVHRIIRTVRGDVSSARSAHEGGASTSPGRHGAAGIRTKYTRATARLTTRRGGGGAETRVRLGDR